MVYYTSDFRILRRWTDKITLQHTAVRRKNYDNVLYYENVCSLRVSNFKTKSKYKYRWTGGQLQKYIKIIYYIRVVCSSNTDRHVQHTCCYCVFLVETENVQLGPEKKTARRVDFYGPFWPSRLHASIPLHTNMRIDLPKTVLYTLPPDGFPQEPPLTHTWFTTLVRGGTRVSWTWLLIVGAAVYRKELPLRPQVGRMRLYDGNNFRNLELAYFILLLFW